MNTETDRMENLILAHSFFADWLDGKWNYRTARCDAELQGLKLTRWHYLKNILYCAYVYWILRPAIVARMKKQEMNDIPHPADSLPEDWETAWQPSFEDATGEPVTTVVSNGEEPF